MDSVKYVDPPWAKKPFAKWVLSEIKDGSVIDEFEISQRPCTIIGRNEDMVHIVQHHASISRQHVRLAFDATGSLWLKDLSSTHGVTVNKRRLPLKSIGTNESMSTQPGTRGVMLNSGDVIQLGASTRILVVEKFSDINSDLTSVPSELDSSAEKIVSTERDVASRHQEIDFDDEPDTVDQLSTNLTYDNIPPELRNEWQKLEALKRKLENISQESERIQGKESIQEQLTVGQQRQLKRNEERIEDLQKQIASRESDLYSKIHPDRKNIRSKAKSTVADVDDNDDDDFFDRTLKHKDDGNLGDSVETEDSLLLKWSQLIEKRNILEKRIEVAQRNTQMLENRIESMKDSEDVFFAQNELSLAHDKRNKFLAEMSHVTMSLKSIKDLLKITSPRLTLNEETGIVADGKILTNPTSSLAVKDVVYKENDVSDGKSVNTTSQMTDDAEHVQEVMSTPTLPNNATSASISTAAKKIGPMLP